MAEADPSDPAALRIAPDAQPHWAAGWVRGRGHGKVPMARWPSADRDQPELGPEPGRGPVLDPAHLLGRAGRGPALAAAPGAAHSRAGRPHLDPEPRQLQLLDALGLARRAVQCRGAGHCLLSLGLVRSALFLALGHRRQHDQLSRTHDTRPRSPWDALDHGHSQGVGSVALRTHPEPRWTACLSGFPSRMPAMRSLLIPFHERFDIGSLLVLAQTHIPYLSKLHVPARFASNRSFQSIATTLGRAQPQTSIILY
ncbi:uncharacterized protein BJ171DRAFT_510953 [Polychytrium aggregatum]|uniref:uncharacterized protein n=1 Tax=Polychytrium aggregatum TaxID=110093 RepID=UPI0022FF2A2A|nr:uncharacterized protein BJ171DRAFT_510953 [Polychytrium aggregatum]KAI9203133.1 hypothetical protein BJ171DRAFT_510953 [Polychytrium aggregatum]